jgi:hypothetical protein
MDEFYKRICDCGDYITLKDVSKKLLTPELVNDMIELLEKNITKLDYLMLGEIDNSCMFNTVDLKKCIEYLKNINKKNI